MTAVLVDAITGMVISLIVVATPTDRVPEGTRLVPLPPNVAMTQNWRHDRVQGWIAPDNYVVVENDKVVAVVQRPKGAPAPVPSTGRKAVRFDEGHPYGVGWTHRDVDGFVAPNDKRVQP